MPRIFKIKVVVAESAKVPSKAVKPALLRLLLFAPLYKRSLTISSLPKKAAPCSAVVSSLLVKFTSTPSLINSETVSRSPIIAAHERGVTPSLTSGFSISFGLMRNRLMVFLLPVRIAPAKDLSSRLTLIEPALITLLET